MSEADGSRRDDANDPPERKARRCRETAVNVPAYQQQGSRAQRPFTATLIVIMIKYSQKEAG